jgi:hypothetical protein
MDVKRRILAASAALAMTLSVVGGVAAAPPGTEYGVNDQNSTKSGNCIAYFSAPHQHNGQAPTLGQGGDPSHGTRGDEIRALQESCNLANEN